MSKDNDIVDDIFSRIKEILSDDLKCNFVIKLDGIEKKIRQDWGGTEPYIAKKRNIQKKKSDALMVLRLGFSVKEASKRADISESSIYRMLRRR